MFTLPPRPPYDYKLQGMNPNQYSSTTFTPYSYPRITQPEIGLYCYPLFSDDVPPPKVEEKHHPLILEKITQNAKALWVDRPEENANLIHDVVKKYSVVVDPDYNPQYKARPKLIPRSYKYELDCIEYERLGLLWAKMERERKEDARALQKHLERAQRKVEPPFKPLPCKFPPPPWWKDKPKEPKAPVADKTPTETPSSEPLIAPYKRWQQKPSLTSIGIDDPCEKRFLLAQVGQPFKNEAINWYFKNYPPPNIKFRPEKFCH